MSELKARRIGQLMSETGRCDTEVYLKSEADKVIQELVERTCSMIRDPQYCRGLDKKTPIGKIADVAFKHWNQIERKNKYYETVQETSEMRYRRIQELNSLNNALLHDALRDRDRIRHHARKRCLAMARWCASRSASWCLDPADEQLHKSEFYEKWHKRWLELAEQFKEGV